MLRDTCGEPGLSEELRGGTCLALDCQEDEASGKQQVRKSSCEVGGSKHLCVDGRKPASTQAMVDKRASSGHSAAVSDSGAMSSPKRREGEEGRHD